VTAAATLRFDYAQRVVSLDPMGHRAIPGEYDLCEQHAARTTPPSGWTLRDRAPSRAAVTEPAPPVGPERSSHVGRLAAALSAVPRTVSEDVPDAVPVGTDRSVPHPSLAPSLNDDASTEHVPVTSVPTGPARLDALMGGGHRSVADRTEPRAEHVVERAPQDDVDDALPHTRTLRLAPDPISSAWCADLMSPGGRTTPTPSQVVPSHVAPLHVAPSHVAPSHVVAPAHHAPFGRSSASPTLFG
jgi:hypothetical protein